MSANTEPTLEDSICTGLEVTTKAEAPFLDPREQVATGSEPKLKRARMKPGGGRPPERCVKCEAANSSPTACAASKHCLCCGLVGTGKNRARCGATQFASSGKCKALTKEVEHAELIIGQAKDLLIQKNKRIGEQQELIALTQAALEKEIYYSSKQNNKQAEEANPWASGINWRQEAPETEGGYYQPARHPKEKQEVAFFKGAAAHLLAPLKILIEVMFCRT
jgi:hypothetical protein